MAIQYYTACSLDGFIATRDHSLEWLFQFDSGGGESYAAFIAEVGALAMGSHTYEWVQRHLEATGEPWPYAQPAWVFTSRRLRAIAGADVHFASGSVADVLPDMDAAAGGKNIWVVGGGDLAGQFHDVGRLDEVIATVAPVTLGGGAPLLPRAIVRPPMRLVAVQRYGELVELRLRVVREAQDSA